VNANSITLQKVGDTFALQAAVDANNTEVKGAPIGFTSADPRIATVTSVGLVKAVGQGQTEITVSVSGLSVKVAIKVDGVRIEGGDRRGEQ
jgi:uncharacterized protein YjdB